MVEILAVQFRYAIFLRVHLDHKGSFTVWKYVGFDNLTNRRTSAARDMDVESGRTLGFAELGRGAQGAPYIIV